MTAAPRNHSPNSGFPHEHDVVGDTLERAQESWLQRRETAAHSCDFPHRHDVVDDRLERAQKSWRQRRETTAPTVVSPTDTR